jgi:hypothetical protein
MDLYSPYTAILEMDQRRRDDEERNRQEALRRQEEQRVQGIQSEIDRSRLFSELAPLDEQERENERRRAIIEEMRGEATAPLQGRSAGRVYLAPSPFEGLAKLGQAYMARKGGQKAYAEEQRLADQRMKALKAYQDILEARLPEDMARVRGGGAPLPTRKPSRIPALSFNPDEEEEFIAANVYG